MKCDHTPRTRIQSSQKEALLEGAPWSGHMGDPLPSTKRSQHQGPRNITVCSCSAAHRPAGQFCGTGSRWAELHWTFRMGGEVAGPCLGRDSLAWHEGWLPVLGLAFLVVHQSGSLLLTWFTWCSGFQREPEGEQCLLKPDLGPGPVVC